MIINSFFWKKRRINMKKWSVLLACTLALALAACGGEGNENTNANETNQVQSNQVVDQDYHVKFVDALGKEHEFTQVPKTIATLNPGILDILLSLDANVTGRPTISSEISDEIKAIQDLGNVHEPSFEQIVALRPEVLIVPASFQRFAATLESAGIEVIYEDLDSIQQIKDSVKRYGEVFNQEEKANDIIAEIQQAEDEKISSTKNALIVYGAPGTYLAALDNSLYGDILNTVGGHNIASDLPALDQYPNFASLSAEKIVKGDPQVIMLITHANEKVVKSGFEKQMSENAAWKNLDAVKNGNIIILPSDLFDNPGTQVVEALDYIRDVLEKAEASK
jgi:iron complex transport system substrate-binding protein